MKQLLRTFLIVIPVLLAAIAALGQAPERATPAEAKQMVDDAIAHIKEVGTAKAFDDFTAPGGRWHKKDLYVFCYKWDGTNACHGGNRALVGKNLYELKDANGQQFIKGMIDLVQAKGSGWLEYQWPDPLTKKTEPKRSWVIKIPGYEGLIGAGVYKH
jgi:hypothetical protein